MRLTGQIDQRLSLEAQRESQTRPEVARDALDWYLTEMEKSRFMNQLVEEARAAYSNENIRREALEISEAFLPAENEAMDVAEGRKRGKPEAGGHEERWWK